MEALFFRHVVPLPVWKLMRWLSIGKERKLSEAWEVIDQFAEKNITKKKAGRIYREDLLTSYIEEDLKEGENKLMMNNKFLRDMVVNLMFAGRDTTGVALAWFFCLLANNPEVKLKIVEELWEHTCEKAWLTSPSVFNPEEIAKLVYLHATLCETLRLHSSVPFEHKGLLKAEVLPSGKRVKSKEKILFSTYSMGRLEGVWGKDCLEFKPERWISESGTLRHEPSYKFLPFNYGPRTCLGKAIAFAQMKTMATAMICNFDIELIEGHMVKPKKLIILHMKNGLMIKIRQKRQFIDIENN